MKSAARTDSGFTPECSSRIDLFVEWCRRSGFSSTFAETLVMPLRFLFGGKKQPENEQSKETPEDALSEAGTVNISEDEEEDAQNQTFFMNPDFGFLSPSPSRSSSALSNTRLVKRQITRRMSSRIREHRQAAPTDYSEYDVDVEMVPSAFALQMVPNSMRGASFCSRDDSEIATRTNLEAMRELASSTSSRNTPYVNALFLHSMSFNDDSDVASCSCGKIPLRHMGSALSYRLSMSGTPDCSVYGDEDIKLQSFKRPGHSRHHSDASIASVKERNQMVSLESLVEAMPKENDPVFEFGLINPDSLLALQNRPTPRLTRSVSDKGVTSSKIPQKTDNGLLVLNDEAPEALSSQLSSYPLFLVNIMEEEEEDEDSKYPDSLIEKCEAEDENEESNYREEETPKRSECGKRCDVPPIRGLRANRDSEGWNSFHSSFKVRVEPIEVTENAGFVNPAFDQDFVDEPEDIPEKKAKKFMKMPSIKRKKSTKKNQVEDTDPHLDVAVRRNGGKRDESLHVALLERFLVQSIVNKCIAE